MQFKPVYLLLLFFWFQFGNGQEGKEYNTVFEKQLLNPHYSGEQNISTGDYLLKNAINDSQKAQAYFLLVQGQNKLGVIEKSIENLFLAKKLSEQENNAFLRAYAEISLSRHCNNYGISDKGSTYLTDAKNRIEDIKDKKQKAIIESLILESEARDLVTSNNLTKALELLKQQEVLSKNNALPEIFLTNNKNLQGYCYYKASQFDLSKQYLNENLEILKRNNVSASCSMKYVNYGLACISLQKGAADFNKHIELLKQDFACKPIYEVLWTKELQVILAQKGKTDLASIYAEKTSQLEVQDIENRRIGRSIMLSQIEKDSDTSSVLSKILSTKGILILLGVLLLMIAFYVYNSVKYKREYAQFKKIMSESEAGIKTYVPQEAPTMTAVTSDDEKEEDELGMNQKSKEAILEKLNQFERMELYLSADMSLEKLSKYTDANSKYVREIIQKYKSKNYSSYINELRINHVINLLKNNPEYLKYKVSYLAEISGFSSHSAFSVVFRSVAGLSPNQFIEFLKKEKSHILRKSS
ncbi:AraC family transcriptional regulator [Flavobacterium sp.]|uniref:helix-turn-helix domain-containing protein n=1 Tax=Flavobacterium sp. TaxID=239 RepID=UPI0028BDBE85|nr:AraC family transcriptional regulator [Flavobacterium sp.]